MNPYDHNPYQDQPLPKQSQVQGFRQAYQTLRNSLVSLEQMVEFVRLDLSAFRMSFEQFLHQSAESYRNASRRRQSERNDVVRRAEVLARLERELDVVRQNAKHGNVER